MNKQQTLHCIKVMQDFVDGKDIVNVNTKSGCTAWTEDPSWGWDNNPNSYYSSTVSAEGEIGKLKGIIIELTNEIRTLEKSLAELKHPLRKEENPTQPKDYGDFLYKNYPEGKIK